MTGTEWIVILVILAGVLLVGALLFRRSTGTGKERSKVAVKGLGISVSGESSNDVTPGISVEDVTSTQGGLTAHDKTGRGIRAGKLHAQNDITLTNSNPEDSPDPKL